MWRHLASMVALVLAVLGAPVPPAGAGAPGGGADGWVEVDELTADGAGDGDRFGSSLAVAGDTLAVGSSRAIVDGVRGGSVQIFERTGAVWRQVEEVVAGDPEAEARFGSSVALGPDTLVVGALLEDGVGTNSGAVYVFTRDAQGAWTQQAKLTAPDGIAQHNFGHAVDLHEGVLAASAFRDGDAATEAGAVYVFERAGDTWTQVAKLTASDARPADWFGHGLALGDGVLAAGSRLADPLGTRSGAAYVFERGAGGWTEVAKLTASDGAAEDSFGFTLALDGDTLIVGLEDATTDAGAAYVFVRGADASWTEEAKLEASDGGAFDRFGVAVSVRGDTALVGATRADGDATDQGGAYVFTRDGAAWTEETKLVPRDGVQGDLAGIDVLLSARGAFVASRTDGAGTDSGSVIVYRETGPPG